LLSDAHIAYDLKVRCEGKNTASTASPAKISDTAWDLCVQSLGPHNRKYSWITFTKDSSEWQRGILVRNLTNLRVRPCLCPTASRPPRVAPSATHTGAGAADGLRRSGESEAACQGVKLIPRQSYFGESRAMVDPLRAGSGSVDPSKVRQSIGARHEGENWSRGQGFA
jgi:hypothetical protein